MSLPVYSVSVFVFGRDNLMNHLLPSALVEPISLPVSAVPLPRDNEEGIVVGFSYTNATGQPDDNSVLQGVYLQTIISGRCTSSHIVNPLQNSFCASDPYYSSNSCNGNVGSGFVVRSRGSDLLVQFVECLCRPCVDFSNHFFSQFRLVFWTHSIHCVA